MIGQREKQTVIDRADSGYVAWRFDGEAVRFRIFPHLYEKGIIAVGNSHKKQEKEKSTFFMIILVG